MKKYIIATLLVGVSFAVGFAQMTASVSVTPDDATPMQASGSYCPNLSSTIYRGLTDAKTSGQVTELQKFLADYYNIELSGGFFGRTTQSYVIKFQKDNNLPSFGTVGVLTRAKIADVCSSDTGANDTSNVTTPNNPSSNYPTPTNNINPNATPQTGAYSNSPTPTVESLGTPTLNIQYDSNYKESALISKSAVRVTAGSDGLLINKAGSTYSASMALFGVNLMNTNGSDANVYPLPSVILQSGNVVDNGTYWTIPAGQYGVFYVTNTYKPRSLLAGSYFTKISLSKGGESYQISNNQSNVVTIIGETTPYISAVNVDETSMGKSVYIITGTRFSPTSNSVTINGVTRLIPSNVTYTSSGNVGASIPFNITDFGITSAGAYIIQVSTSEGVSNNYAFAVASVQSASTPTIEFIGTPSLNLQYDSQGKESVLAGSATVKVTTGNTSVSVSALPQILSFSKDSGAVWSNGVRFYAYSNVLGGTGTIPPNTSAVFNLNNSVPAKELFSGTYHLGFTGLQYIDANGNYQTLPASSFVNAQQSNSVTVIGETSPYITSATSDSMGNIMLTGVRFDPTSNTVSIGNGTVTLPSSNNGTTITIPGNSSGTYVIQVSTREGASNRYSVTVGNMYQPSSVGACKVQDIFASQVPGFVYYNLYIKTNGLPSSVYYPVSISGSDSWDSLTFSADPAGSGYLIASQTINSTGISYILARKGNIKLIQNGITVCDSMASVPVPLANQSPSVIVSSGISENTPQVLGAFASKTACVDIPYNMHRGNESSWVNVLQKFLQDKGLLNESPTGFYGDKTLEAVKTYQNSKGIKESGMAYEATRQAINEETCK